jgi:CRISPR-associated endoribonuclease Cas6
MQDYESSDMRIVSTEIREIKQKHIDFLETITPAIVTVDGKPWLLDGDILLLVQRIHANAEKKFKFFCNEEIGEVEDYFIEKLKILNKKPACYSYKGIKLLGNKFRIKVNEDEKSQKLAFIVLSSGLSEKNSSLGAGFCKCNWR